MGNRNSGRRPIPTALKVLRGNPGKNAMNKYEPVPVDGEVVKPDYLSAGASGIWDRLAPLCLGMGTLTAADVTTFSTLCELQATFQQAAAAKDGRTLLTLAMDRDESQLVVVIDSVLRLERDTASALKSYYGMFGLEPSSRTKLVVKQPDTAPVSKWAGLQ